MKGKKIQIQIRPFPADLTVWVGRTKQFKAQLQEFGYTWNASGRDGYFYGNGLDCHVWLHAFDKTSPEDVGLLVHELVHVCGHILDTCDVHDEECAAYLIQDMTLQAIGQL